MIVHFVRPTFFFFKTNKMTRQATHAPEISVTFSLNNTVSCISITVQNCLIPVTLITQRYKMVFFYELDIRNNKMAATVLGGGAPANSHTGRNVEVSLYLLISILFTLVTLPSKSGYNNAQTKLPSGIVTGNAVISFQADSAKMF